MDIEKLLSANPAMTDIHLTEGLPLMIRVYGALKKMKEIAEPQLLQSSSLPMCLPIDRRRISGQEARTVRFLWEMSAAVCICIAAAVWHRRRSASCRSFLCSARIPTGRGWRRYRSFRTGLSSSPALREAARVRRWRAFFR